MCRGCRRYTHINYTQTHGRNIQIFLPAPGIEHKDLCVAVLYGNRSGTEAGIMLHRSNFLLNLDVFVKCNTIKLKKKYPLTYDGNVKKVRGRK